MSLDYQGFRARLQDMGCAWEREWECSGWLSGDEIMPDEAAQDCVQETTCVNREEVVNNDVFRN
jgi:hypothetical protein